MSADAGARTDAAVLDAGGGDTGPADTGAPDAGVGDVGAADTGGATSDTGATPDVGVDGGPVWPTCDAPPPGVPSATIPDVWAADPGVPTAYWVPGVYVTAISGGGCVADTACQFFVQQAESYATLAAASQQSLRVAIAPAAASRFTSVAVGDRIDLYAAAFRDTTDGRNELIFLLSDALPGCALTTGAGDPQPVTATLDDLTVAAYETSMGPVLMRIDFVSGRPALPAETFALWTTGGTPGGDITMVTSLSPFFMPTATFSGLTASTITDFQYVIGVFGLFVPPPAGGPVMKYEEIYVRTTADYQAL